MTTPKSPEQIMEEYRINLNRTAFIHGAAFTPGEEWLRSSMASLLCYMAKNLKKKDLCRCMCEENRERQIYNTAVSDFRTLLIEEARRILEK